MSSAARPPARFALSAGLFLRLLAVVHLVAFASAWTQLAGLIGPHGLLPAQPFFDAVRTQLGPAAARDELPSLCWWFGATTFLPVLCATGIALSLLLFAGIAPAPALVGLWACYLSLCGAGQVFFNFQWDSLLLETTLLAVFLAPWKLLPLWRPHEPPPLARLLLVWLLFRLMLVSGAVKLLSGDPAWRDLTALTFHYETQPLPTPLAYWAHQLPAWLQRAACAGLFAIELLVPFFFFAPRGLRHRAALLTAALMLLIALTGNYTFFNFLTAALCVLLLDDTLLARLLPPRFPPAISHLLNDKRPGTAPFPLSSAPPKQLCHLLDDITPPAPPSAPASNPPPARRPRWPLRLFAAFVFAYTTLDTLPVFFRHLGPVPGFNALSAALAPYRSFNRYGLFAVMTNPRPELVFEGSDDARTWLAYDFPYKPGDLARAPTWVAPHQPRLDWQLWFAALGPPAQNPWVLTLAEHFLRGTPEVLALVAKNPFAARPPRYVRVVRYEYHFTDSATRAATGQIWRRAPFDFYLLPAALR